MGKLYRVDTSNGRSSGFGSRSAAERFAAGLAASGKCDGADIVSYDAPDDVPDEVIAYAATAARNHATEVHGALAAYLELPTQERARTLRMALVALSEGFESSAHDGSTFEARRDAAVAAIEAWDS